MKSILIAIFCIVLVSVIAIFVYDKGTKESTGTLPTVSLTGSTGLKTTSLVVGQKLTVTLQSPTDGYEFDRPEYDTSLIHLDSRNGNVWSFTAVSAGVTDLTITASRPEQTDAKIDIFKTAIAVQ